MIYNNEPGRALLASEILKHPEGKGECKAWADLLAIVLEVQGVPAIDLAILPRIDRNRFEFIPRPAQGSGVANYDVVPLTVEG